jgi:O-antigen ligase/polysaccharide polymerase Wzy-like membrane protein
VSVAASIARPAPRAAAPWGLLAPALAAGAALGIALVWLPPMLAVAAPAGLLVAWLVLRDPRLGLFFTIASIPLEAAGMVARLAPSLTVTLTKVLALLTLAAWIVHLLLRRRTLLWTREIAAFTAVMACAAFSLIDAREPSAGVQGLIRLGSTYLFFVMAVNLLEGLRDVRRALAILLCASSLMFAFAVAQRYLPSYTFEQRAGWSERGDWKYGVEEVTIDPIEGRSIARSSGTALHSVILSATTAMMVPVLLGFMRIGRSPHVRALAAGGLAAALAANVVSVSRTGVMMLALVLAYAVLRGLVRLSWRAVLIAVPVALCALMLMPRAFLVRMFAPSSYQSASSESLRIRLETNLGALNAIAHNPVNGLGVGSMLGLQDYYVDPESDYLRTRGLQNFSTANNTYLQTGLEIGLPGVAALFWLFWLYWRALRDARRGFAAQGDVRTAILCECLGLALLAMLVAGLTVDFVQQTFKGFWLMMACGVVLRRAAALPPDARPSRAELAA